MKSNFEELMRKWNPCTSSGAIKKLPVFKGYVGQEKILGYTLVDSSIYKVWSVIKWGLSSKGYVRANLTLRNRERLGDNIELIDGITATYIMLHGIVCNSENPNLHVDHVNHDKLDNRFCSLRLVTNQQNVFNRRKLKGSSKYKGVCFVPTQPINPWRVKIMVNGDTQPVKSYKTEIEAAQEYDKLALKHFGKHACLNFPE